MLQTTSIGPLHLSDRGRRDQQGVQDQVPDGDLDRDSHRRTSRPGHLPGRTLDPAGRMDRRRRGLQNLPLLPRGRCPPTGLRDRPSVFQGHHPVAGVDGPGTGTGQPATRPDRPRRNEVRTLLGGRLRRGGGRSVRIPRLFLARVPRLLPPRPHHDKEPRHRTVHVRTLLLDAKERELPPLLRPETHRGVGARLSGETEDGRRTLRLRRHPGPAGPTGAPPGLLRRKDQRPSTLQEGGRSPANTVLRRHLPLPLRAQDPDLSRGTSPDRHEGFPASGPLLWPGQGQDLASPRPVPPRLAPQGGRTSLLLPVCHLRRDQKRRFLHLRRRRQDPGGNLVHAGDS